MFGPNPDGEGIILRLWEQAGTGGVCKITLPAGMDVDAVQPCNLRGAHIGGPIAVRRGVFSVEVNEYAPVSLILK